MTESRAERFRRELPDFDQMVQNVAGDGGGTDLTDYYNKMQVDALIDQGSRYRGTWAPNTAYKTNDIITHHNEGIYVITSNHISSSSFSLVNKKRINGRARTYDVMDYGAVADDSTDNTTIIKNLIQLAVDEGRSDGSHFARIHFPPGVYVVSSATTKGGDTEGNAQIPLPRIPVDGQKFSLVLSGTENGSAFSHWLQAAPQKSGTVIRSTLTGLSNDGTWGPPSVIGGPKEQSTGIFTNLLLTVDGITVVTPHNPGIIAFDFAYVAQVVIKSAGALANASVAGSPTLTTLPTNDLGIGLRMPLNNNNDCAVVHDFSCEGFYYGTVIGEHFTALRLAHIYCQVGIFIARVGGASYHGATIINYSAEATPIHIQCLDSDGGSFPLEIMGMHTETANQYTVDDLNNNLTGTIRWSNISNDPPTTRGAANIKIISNSQASAPGRKIPPAIPSSTSAYLNPFWRDCAVTVSGGTVTAIAVDGSTTGVTSGTVIVPSNKTITITYSVAPTWNWVAI